jgi:hypothetical protein
MSLRIQQEEDIQMTDFTPTIQNPHDGTADDSVAENRREEQQLPHSTHDDVGQITVESRV